MRWNLVLQDPPCSSRVGDPEDGKGTGDLPERELLIAKAVNLLPEFLVSSSRIRRRFMAKCCAAGSAGSRRVRVGDSERAETVSKHGETISVRNGSKRFRSPGGSSSLRLLPPGVPDAEADAAEPDLSVGRNFESGVGHGHAYKDVPPFLSRMVQSSQH